jgi:Spy/CpxP family protein refolding chaperone
MKKRMTFALAAALFASTFSAFPHVAAAKPTAPPPQGQKSYPLPGFHNLVVTGLMDGILSVLLR